MPEISSSALALVVGLAAAALLFGVGVAVYVLVSFALARRAGEGRPLSLAVRAMAREALLATLSQPFLPLFYLVGRRMDRWLLRGARGGLERLAAEEAQADRVLEVATGKGPVPIVLVHGYMQNRVGFVRLARELAAAGLGPIFGFNYPWFASIERNAERLARFVDDVCRETGAPSVDLVCHSMGGLVAVEMMRLRAKDSALRVRRCVTIATPHAGVAWRGPILGIGATSLRRGSALLESHAGTRLGVPCLSVYSSHDNVVHPKHSSSLGARGGRDVEVAGEGHLALLFSKSVAEHVVSFLAEPDPV